MLIKGARLICDICERAAFVTAENNMDTGWRELFLCGVGESILRTSSPNHLCPDCAKKIALAIDNMGRNNDDNH